MPTPGPRTTYKYSEEFKATAVKLSQLPGVAIKDVAESLCIHPFMLSRWRKAAREGLIMTKGVDINRDIAAELKALRRMKKDYERLKLEQACRENIIFMALSADTQPHFTTIASFISTMDQQIVPLFRNVLLICDELKLIGGDMFAIDAQPDSEQTQREAQY